MRHASLTGQLRRWLRRRARAARPTAPSRRARIELLEERQLLSIDLVSIAPVSSTGNFGSEEASISADGRYVAFSSDATNLVASDTNNTRDIFVVDRTTGATALVSTDASGNQAHGDCDWPYLSGDGRYVTFQSAATNLVADDTNSVADVFRKDMLDGSTIRVSTDSAGAAGAAASYSAGISADGRYVVFETAGNLVSGGNANIRQIWVKDVLAGVTTLASADAAGSAADATSSDSSVSGDGRYVAFISHATNLASDDTAGQDVFVKDLAGGAVVRVATDVSNYGNSSNRNTTGLSGDGRYVAFRSAALLVPGEADSLNDVFVTDLLSGVTTKASTDSAGAAASSDSESASISSDGRYVAFRSLASNLVTDDTNGCADIFVKDLATGVTTRISQDANGQQGNAASQTPRISGDGRFVAFQSVATNLASSDFNSHADVLVGDCATGALSVGSARLGTTATGGNRDSWQATVSSDGRYVAFTSSSTDLGQYDGDVASVRVYLRDLAAGTTTCVNPGLGCTDPSISADGRYVGLSVGVRSMSVRDTWTGVSTMVSAPMQYYLMYTQIPPQNQVPSLSSDGRYVAFAADYGWPRGGRSADVYVQDLWAGTQTKVASGMSNVQTRISGDGRYVAYVIGSVYVRDLVAGTTAVASSDSLGTAAVGGDPAISNDGRYVAFSSTAEDLVADDTNGVSDIFLKDLANGVTVRVSTDAEGGEADGPSVRPRISGDGRYLVFESAADNLVPDDTNGLFDVFVKDLISGTAVRVNIGSSGEQANQACYAPVISGDGHYIVFQSTATNLHPADTRTTTDVYRVWNPLVAPEVSLYGTTVRENRPVGTGVGVLATGAQSSGPFTYTLVAGEGDADNGTFTIDGSTLRTAATFDFETRAAYTIRVRSTDDGSVSCEQSFTITVDDVHPIACPALYDPETSFFTLRGSNGGESTDTSFGYGEPGADWIALVGDWNGDQASGVGFYDPEGSCFYLTDSHEGGYSRYAFGYGEPGAGWIPLVGDWNGDGRCGVGLYNPQASTFYLTDSMEGGFAQYTFGYGEPGAGWTPLVGDWDGDGQCGVALYDPQKFAFYLTDALQTGVAERYYRYSTAKAGWLPLVGDWDGNGSDGIGLYAPETSVFQLVSVVSTGYVPYTFGYGAPGAGWKPLAGDWDGNGACGVGLYDPATSTFYLTNRLTTGFADYTYVFGTPGAVQPLVGCWTTTEANDTAQAVDQIDLEGLAADVLSARTLT